MVSIQPTYTGYVDTTEDALILFEAYLSGGLRHVPRRPRDHERSSLIRSGSVFIYNEKTSGIKRWTDGVAWSPSRILGSFLLYRELDRPFASGEKKTAIKKSQRYPVQSDELYAAPPTFAAPSTPSDYEQRLRGSLVDSYHFKSGGLVKKTMSVTVRDESHHLISYYQMDHVTANLLQRPSDAPDLAGIRPRAELTPKLRPPEEVDQTTHGAREGTNSGHWPVALANSCPHHAEYPQYGHQSHVSAGCWVLPPNTAPRRPIRCT